MKAYLFKKLASWIVGGDLFTFIEETVRALITADMSGASKKDAVVDTVTKNFLPTPEKQSLINLAIEVAVYFAKRD